MPSTGYTYTIPRDSCTNLECYLCLLVSVYLIYQHFASFTSILLGVQEIVWIIFLSSLLLFWSGVMSLRVSCEALWILFIPQGSDILMEYLLFLFCRDAFDVSFRNTFENDGAVMHGNRRKGSDFISKCEYICPWHVRLAMQLQVDDNSLQNNDVIPWHLTQSEDHRSQSIWYTSYTTVMVGYPQTFTTWK